MKIQSLTTGFVGYSTRVREKQDTESSGQSPEHSSDQKSDSQSQEDSESEAAQSDVSYEKVEQAVEAFHSQEHALTRGLNAAVSGQGPGLKVILTDRAGGVVRSMTGAEFLRLREATSHEGQIRGKILDQKL